MKSYARHKTDAFGWYIFQRLRKDTGVFVDIGAGDGISWSQSYLFFKNGWSGMVIDANESDIELARENLKDLKVKCVAMTVTPANIGSRLGTDPIDALSLDIDCYDFEVLCDILFDRAGTIDVLFLEANPYVIPPVRFHVKYGEGVKSRGDYFFGMSIRTLHILLEAYDYDIVEFVYGDVVAVRRPLVTRLGLTPLSLDDIMWHKWFNLAGEGAEDHIEWFRAISFDGRRLLSQPDAEKLAFYKEKFKDCSPHHLGL